MLNASAQRRARAKENLRRAILDAARELFATEDYHAVSMRRIAEKIEYSPTAIYLHFKDKEDILFALINEGFTELNARLSAVRIENPVERLGEGGRAYFKFAFDNPHYYRLMFQLEDADLICKYAEVNQTPPECSDFIRQAVSEAREQHLFIADRSIEAVSHAIWASIHGAAALKLSGMLDFKLPQEARDEFFETLIENTINGQRPCA